MGTHEELRLRILQGKSDANIGFGELVRMLQGLGFEERTRGSHHIFQEAGRQGTARSRFREQTGHTRYYAGVYIHPQKAKRKQPKSLSTRTPSQHCGGSGMLRTTVPATCAGFQFEPQVASNHLIV